MPEKPSEVEANRSTGQDTKGSWKPSWRVLALAGLMGGAGITHFVAPAAYDLVMPRAIPEQFHRSLTYGSGVAELVCAGLLLHPRTRRLGGTVTAVTLVAVFPANIDSALAGGLPVDGWLGTRTAAILRLPLQIPLILGALWIRRHGR